MRRQCLIGVDGQPLTLAECALSDGLMETQPHSAGSITISLCNPELCYPEMYMYTMVIVGGGGVDRNLTPGTGPGIVWAWSQSRAWTN